jgi:hypothetical protein
VGHYGYILLKLAATRSPYFTLQNQDSMKNKIITTIFFGLMCLTLFAQRGGEKSEAMFSGMQLRNVGPAFTSGRIADIAIHPRDNSTWYVAVGSGGVWKTAEFRRNLDTRF